MSCSVRRFSSSMSFMAAGLSVALSALVAQAAGLDEVKVRERLMQRFDENRNDKLESSEARQARSRLKNLLEDRSEREINILTWRDDVRELLKSLDQDEDNRLGIVECDEARALLEKLIPRVDPNAPRERESSEAKKSSATKDRDSHRFERSSNINYRGAGSSSGSGSSGRFFMGEAMGGGGFGNIGMFASTNRGNNPWLESFNSPTKNGGRLSSLSGFGSSGSHGSLGDSATAGMGRPGAGDPGRGMGTNSAGSMAFGGGAVASSGAAAAFGDSSFDRPSSNSGLDRPATGGGTAAGSVGNTPGSPRPSAGGPLTNGGDRPGSVPGTLDGGTKPGTGSSSGGTGSGASTPTKPASDDLGGGAAPPTTGGNGPQGTGGTTTVPFNPKPNF